MRTIIYMFCAVSTICASGADRFLVAPNHLDNPAGGNTTGWPFTFSDSGITSRRYQQVYDASQFATAAPEGAYIKGVWFRPDMLLGPGAHDFLDSVQVNLGVTPRSPDSLSPIFSENIGPQYTMAYGPSPLEVSTLATWTTIPLSQPFLYLPASGNLLLDIRTVDNSPYPLARRILDGEETFGDSISAVMAIDVNATSGVLTTRGLVTGFLFEPIPEPSTWALLGLGLLGMWRFFVRRNNHNYHDSQTTKTKG